VHGVDADLLECLDNVTGSEHSYTNISC
jgi:hypothetical protein